MDNKTDIVRRISIVEVTQMPNGDVKFRIDEQTVRDEDFSANGAVFFASNGLDIESYKYPAWYGSCNS